MNVEMLKFEIEQKQIAAEIRRDQANVLRRAKRLKRAKDLVDAAHASRAAAIEDTERQIRAALRAYNFKLRQRAFVARGGDPFIGTGDDLYVPRGF